jgi:cell pole-organizing protein PopZ
MAEEPKQSDQSMEEILQSIKRIIAEEGDEGATVADKSEATAAANGDASNAPDADADTLELTQQVSDEEISQMKAEDENAEPIGVDALLDSLADDDDDSTDQAVAEEPQDAAAAADAFEAVAVDALADAENAAEAADAFEAVTVTPEAETPEASETQEAPAEEAQSAADAADAFEAVSVDAVVAEVQPPSETAQAPVSEEPTNDDGLISTEALAASTAALKRLQEDQSANTASESAMGNIAFRSGETLEDLVLEAMRPMLRDWLDANLPQMVEKLVAREITKMRDQLN